MESHITKPSSRACLGLDVGEKTDFNDVKTKWYLSYLKEDLEPEEAPKKTQIRPQFLTTKPSQMEAAEINPQEGMFRTPVGKEKKTWTS